MDDDTIKTMRISPIGHPDNKDLWRVPLRKIKEEHTVFIGDNITRIFDNATLPNSIKTKMTMIASVVSPYLLYDDTFNISYALFSYDRAVTGFSEIGWQVTPSWYCVCLNSNEIEDLKGN